MSSAPADVFGQERNFLALPAGSTVITSDGDTLLVSEDSWVINNTSIVGMDRSLREARSSAAFHEENYNLRTQQVQGYSALTDSLTRAVAAEQAWREVAIKELERLDTSWVEKVLWGVAGYTVGRAATPGG